VITMCHHRAGYRYGIAGSNAPSSLQMISRTPTLAEWPYPWCGLPATSRRGGQYHKKTRPARRRQLMTD
jgi:hypothetical protein